MQIVKHAFWDEQPVARFADTQGKEVARGELVKIKPGDGRTSPYPLPPGFEWHSLNPNNDDDLASIYGFMRKNYRDETEESLTVQLSADFFKWVLTLPNAAKNWVVGVRVQSSKVLVGLVTAIPSTVSVEGKVVKAAVVGFLCTHLRARNKRLAPVLIKELRRRVSLGKVYQAAYTNPKLVTAPVCRARYWYRIVDYKSTIAVSWG